MELIDFSSSVWSIVPALLAIILAIATAVFCFPLVRGLLLIINAKRIGKSAAHLIIWQKMWFLWFMPMVKSNSNMNIVLFLLLLGVLTALLTVSGSNRAFC